MAARTSKKYALSKTAYLEVLRHLDYAQQYLEGRPSQRCRSRAFTIRQLIRRLQKITPA